MILMYCSLQFTCILERQNVYSKLCRSESATITETDPHSSEKLRAKNKLKKVGFMSLCNVHVHALILHMCMHVHVHVHCICTCIIYLHGRSGKYHCCM